MLEKLLQRHRPIRREDGIRELRKHLDDAGPPAVVITVSERITATAIAGIRYCTGACAMMVEGRVRSSSTSCVAGGEGDGAAHALESERQQATSTSTRDIAQVLELSS